MMYVGSRTAGLAWQRRIVGGVGKILEEVEALVEIVGRLGAVVGKEDTEEESQRELAEVVRA
jgi:hypothetical protein